MFLCFDLGQSMFKGLDGAKLILLYPLRKWWHNSSSDIKIPNLSRNSRSGARKEPINAKNHLKQENRAEELQYLL